MLFFIGVTIENGVRETTYEQEQIQVQGYYPGESVGIAIERALSGWHKSDHLPERPVVTLRKGDGITIHVTRWE